MSKRLVAQKAKTTRTTSGSRLRDLVRRRLEWIERRPADASDYIAHLATIHRIKHVTAVVLFCRVSERYQEWNGNDDDQEMNLMRKMEQYGIKIVASFKECGPGWRRDDRPVFKAVIKMAKKHGVPLVAESVERFLRHEDYKGDQALQPTTKDFDHLMQLAEGVTLATLLVPDAPPASVRWYEQDRGKRAKGNIGGRPKKTPPGAMVKRRRKLRPLARYLHRRIGLSLNEIVARTAFASAEPKPVGRSTVQDWVSEA